MTYTPPSAFSGKIYFEAMIVVRTPSWYIATPATIDLSAAPAETATVTSVGPSGAATATVTRTAATGTAKTTTTKTPTSNPVAGNPTTANLLTFESVATSPTIFYILWSAIAALALISLCTRRMENGVENRALDTAIVHAAARREEMTMAPTWNSSVHGQQQIASRGQNGTVRAQAPEVPTLARTTMRDPGVWGGSTYDPWRGGR